jgi:hypothetical protein
LFFPLFHHSLARSLANIAATFSSLSFCFTSPFKNNNINNIFCLMTLKFLISHSFYPHSSKNCVKRVRKMKPRWLAFIFHNSLQFSDARNVKCFFKHKKNNVLHRNE